jgi:hypothetical protein
MPATVHELVNCKGRTVLESGIALAVLVCND